jgi:dynein heavy chain
MLVGATMEVYRNTMLLFLPTPSKPHYTFNLRDFSRVIRGVLLVPNSRLNEPQKLLRLWIHESFRVFCDRLVNEEDRYTLLNKIFMNITCRICYIEINK